MDIPGIIAKHAVVSTTCRINRGDIGAIEEAIDRIREEAFTCIQYWPREKNAKFHFVFTVEQDTAVEEDE